MEILPIPTTLLQRGSDLASEIQRAGILKLGDILVVSSKVVSVTEGSVVRLADLEPREEAQTLASATGLDAHFTELVLTETERMNGAVLGSCTHAVLTSLHPSGMKRGGILCPNAGADQSNIGEGYAVPWPLDPMKSAKKLWETLGVPVIISDSCCHAGRLGVTAFALTVAGMDPMKNQIGKQDLYGRTMRITQEAVADQLATAANAVMGNTAESIPAAVIRDHGIPTSTFVGWVDGIEPEDDLFRGVI